MKKLMVKIIGLVLTLSVIGGAILLVNKNFPASNLLKVEMILGRDSRMISRLGPDVRLRNQNGYQEILDSPVYFDVRALPWFSGAWIEIIHQSSPRELVGVGGQVSEPWGYDIKQPLSTVPLANGWQRSTFYVDLDSLLDKRNLKRFVIDSRGQVGEPLRISHITVILER